mgnify:FL=1
MKKNIIKKTISVTLAMSMVVGLSACGNKSGVKKEDYSIGEIKSEEDNPEYNTGASQNYNDIYNDVDIEYAAETIQADGYCGYNEPPYYVYDNQNEYSEVGDNEWQSIEKAPLSTFAADVDTASYTQIMNTPVGNVSPDMVRIEEMINYFHYDYPAPDVDDKFSVYTEYIDCPWNEGNKLALVSLNTEPIDFREAPSSNLVFLIDTSGSMFGYDRLGLIQQAFCMLTENLTEKDRVSIVTYAGSDTVALTGATGDDYYRICSVLQDLQAEGSTNGSAGINTAYELAEEYFIEGGNNRVILATDGDLNVGVTSESGLEDLITEKKESGIYLSVIGVGDGNYKDNKLETLADKGNGNYAYIADMFDAKKALVEDLGATMVTVAKDVKLQVEFNQDNVSEYRLIGYENRVMAAEDFSDDTKDGGEMGAGHSVTALYEIVPASDKIDGELFTLNVRYKEPDGDKSKLASYECTSKDYSDNGSDNIRWAAAVAAYGMYLKNSEYMGNTNLDMIDKLACSTDYEDDDYRVNFVERINMEKSGYIRY